MKVKRRFRGDIEPQEIFLDKLAQQREEEFGVPERRLETPLSAAVLLGLWLAFSGLLAVLFLKTFELQVVHGKELKEKALANKFAVSSIQAARGVIYDRDFNQLVFNEPAFDLILEKNKLPKESGEKDKIFTEVCTALKKNCVDFKKEVDKSVSTAILAADNLSQETLVVLEAAIDRWPGFKIEKNAVRTYSEGEFFSHIIGYTSKIKEGELQTLPGDYAITDIVGRDGLERFYETTLARKPGKLRITRDAKGNLLSEEIISLPEAGKGIALFLDAELQKKAAMELERVIKAVGSKKGAVVMMDPRNGAILALASYPRFDNNLFSTTTNSTAFARLFESAYQPLFNRAISGQYPPGSTIKPFTAAAALQEKIISADKSVDCHGLIEIPNQYDRSITYKFRDWATHGITALRKAIAISCNVYFYTIGGGYGGQAGLGPTRIKKYLQIFGWGEKTGIDLPGEKSGFIPDRQWKETVKKEPWRDGDTYHFSIGQGDLLVTPVQVAAAYSAIANGGTIYRPRIVDKIVGPDKNIIEQTKPEVIGQVAVDKENLKIVREGMREGVLYGSSVALNSLPVSSAAKTGTAQTSKDGYYQNWVSVFAPYENPEVVLTVVVEDVQGLQAAAIPVAQGILSWYFTEGK